MKSDDEHDPLMSKDDGDKPKMSLNSNPDERKTSEKEDDDVNNEWII